MYQGVVNFNFAFKACQNINARLATLADKETQDKVTGKKRKNKTNTVTDVIVQFKDKIKDISGLMTDGRTFHSFFKLLIFKANIMLLADLVRRHITPVDHRKNYENSVWLGGQDIAIEGQFVWTSAGGQPFSDDLQWGHGMHL